MNRDYNYIALGDCVELMKEIPDDFIDLTVTSVRRPKRSSLAIFFGP